MASRAEFLENLKGYREASRGAAWRNAGIYSLALFGAFAIILFKIELGPLGPDELVIPFLLFCLICIFYDISRQEKSKDQKFGMHCECCGVRHDWGSLPIAVLENKCAECGAALYDA